MLFITVITSIDDFRIKQVSKVINYMWNCKLLIYSRVKSFINVGQFYYSQCVFKNNFYIHGYFLINLSL